MSNGDFIFNMSAGHITIVCIKYHMSSVVEEGGGWGGVVKDGAFGQLTEGTNPLKGKERTSENLRGSVLFREKGARGSDNYVDERKVQKDIKDVLNITEVCMGGVY